MDHSKITEKNNRIAEELKKKNDAKLKKAAKASSNVAMPGNMSAAAVRAASTLTGSILIKQGGVD